MNIFGSDDLLKILKDQEILVKKAQTFDMICEVLHVGFEVCEKQREHYEITIKAKKGYINIDLKRNIISICEKFKDNGIGVDELFKNREELDRLFKTLS